MYVNFKVPLSSLLSLNRFETKGKLTRTKESIFQDDHSFKKNSFGNIVLKKEKYFLYYEY